MPSLISAVVVDIEGTTTPISFVHDTLSPYARKMLPEFVRSGHSDPAVAAELASVRQAAPGEDPLTVLLGRMDGDAKHTALKTLQGLIWHQGYADGTLKGVLYSDVAPCLGRWHSDGLRLFVYSSGSETAQQLLFSHLDAGDLSKLFTGFFDTRIGPKRAPQSYSTVATQIGLEPQPSFSFPTPRLNSMQPQQQVSPSVSLCGLMTAPWRLIIIVSQQTF